MLDAALEGWLSPSTQDSLEQLLRTREKHGPQGEPGDPVLATGVRQGHFPYEQQGTPSGVERKIMGDGVGGGGAAELNCSS